MLLRFALLLISVKVMDATIMCYSCMHNPNSIGSTPPLLNHNFFHPNNDTSCMDSPTEKTTKIHCSTFCITQRIVQEQNEKPVLKAFFRGCADVRLVLGAICPLDASCYGVFNQGDGILLNKQVMQFGNAFACSTDLCNNPIDSSIPDTQTCDPCKHMGSNCGTCITIDGYTAQCNCTKSRDHSISCPTNPPLPLTTTSTASSPHISSGRTSIRSDTSTIRLSSTSSGDSNSESTAHSPSITISPASSVACPAVLSIGEIAGVCVGTAVFTTLLVSLVCWKLLRTRSSNANPSLELAEIAPRPRTRREPPVFPQERNENHGQDSYYSVPPMNGTGSSKPSPPSSECPKPPPPYHCVAPSTYQVPMRSRFGKKKQEEPREASYVYSSEFGGSSMGYSTQEELENRLRTLY